MKKIQTTVKQLITLSLSAIALSAFFSCNNDTAGNTSTDTVSASPMPATTDTMAAMPNNTMDSSSMNAPAKTDTMHKSMSSGKTKKTAKISVKMMEDNTSKMEMDKNGIYSRAEVKPMFPGGESALDKYISSHIQYPETASDNGTQGTVTVQFAVDEHGKVYQAQEVGSKAGDGLDEEALRVVNAMPQWTPGKIKGKNVKTYYTLPIVFTLQ